MTTATVWTVTGDHILAGTNKGRLNIIDAKTREIIWSSRICSSVVTTLRLTASGRVLLVNSQDRIIRTHHVPNLSAENLDPDTIQVPLEHKFQDVVNRLSWNHVTFSATGEYVAASTYNNHELYIWERGHGSLVRMLEGPKEEQGVIEWHPHRALLAACGLETGRIYIWSVTSPQRWSALAPDFVEVEENVEYVEQEDEFDIHPQEEITKRRLDREDEDIDVLTVDPSSKGYHDDDDDDDDVDEYGRGVGRDMLGDGGDGPAGATAAAATKNGRFRMPVLYNLGDSDSEEEFIAVSAGTVRRKSVDEGQEGEAAVDEAKPGNNNKKTTAAAATKGTRGRKK